ncbi:MAG: hypothetical protein PHW14_05160 [Candidatus Omnitrophica bacterium]|nr:hypothetical protein [Candidatus Omnitrophota bacterium]
MTKRTLMLIVMLSLIVVPGFLFADSDGPDTRQNPKVEKVDLGDNWSDEETIGYGDQTAYRESAEDVRSFGDPFDDENEPVVGPIDAGE